ncbi:MAG: aldose 1-epimerase family protein [Defluviitaleaceae bacterium]|nr:aldose 1-epimerase family protein [Defluviitaleaceae bacterium]
MNNRMHHNDLLRHCNPASLYGARKVTLAEGRGKGHRLIEVKTSAGLAATISEDRCLDIVDLSYKGVNLGFLSKNGMTSTVEPERDSFAKYWSGGFLSTCGLRNTGPACEIDGEFFPTHGNIGLTPAEHGSIHVDENEITITGKMRESALFGHCLEMARKITIPSHGAGITVKDCIRNLTPEAEFILLLYHINFGYPFLSEGLELTFPEGAVRGRTAQAQDKIASRTVLTPPIDGAEELVYFYSPTEKDATVRLTHNALGIQAAISYDSSRLPVLAQWKSMKSGDYALGIEPGTSLIKGRKEELADGYSLLVPAFGTLEFGFTLHLHTHGVTHP